MVGTGTVILKRSGAYKYSLGIVSVLATGIQKNRVSLDKLKLDSAQELINVEIAQRTKDTPPSMQ